MTTHDNAPPPPDWRPEPRMPSFHNTCSITVRSIAAAWCDDHGVRVYRDGTDWLTLPKPREYGPHNTADEPTTVTVRGAGKYATERDVPVPAAVLKQRRRINEIAHRESLPSNTCSGSMRIGQGEVCPDTAAVEPSSSPLGTSLNSAQVEPESTHVRST